MANIPLDARQAYQRLGVKPVINAAGSVTKYGGTRTRPEVLEVMAGAARIMVNVDELNRKAGEEIAKLTGAEAGFVCSGAAGGLVLQAAACIAGKDPVKMRQLPDTTGMADEFIIQNMHRFPYEQAYRAGGAKLVEIGDSRYSHPWELEGAIGENTAAVAFLCAPMTNRRAIPLAQVCEIAHSKGVPVVVDAASILEFQHVVRRIPVAEHVAEYAVSLVRASRPDEAEAPEFVKELMAWGAGPRASLNLILAGKARAALRGRCHVSIDDVRSLCLPVLRHRIIPNFSAQSEGVTADDIIDRILEAVPKDAPLS